MADNLTIPSSRVDFIDPRTGTISREWFLFFLKILGTSTTPSDEVMIGPDVSSLSDQLFEMQKAIQDLELSVTPGSSTEAILTFIAAGAGAVLRTMQNKVREVVSGTDYGMVGDNLTLNTTQASNFALAVPGWDGFIPAGKYKIDSAGTINLDYSYTTTPLGIYVYDGGPVGMLHGAGPQNTILLPQTAAQYVIQATGVATSSVMEASFTDFAVSGRDNIHAVNGINLSIVEGMTLRNIRFEQLDTALKAESVEYFTFEELAFVGNVNGILANIGAGFTHFNAGTIKDCNFLFNTANGLWVQDNAATTNIMGGTFANNGTMGVAGTAAINVTVSGAEGRNGVTIKDVYFEANEGDADIKLVNSGSDKVVHIIQGCSFTRVGNTNYTTHNIVSTGPNIIILIGCSFWGTGGYAANAARSYLSGDAATVFIPIGCTWSDVTEAAGLPSQSTTGPYYVNLSITGGAIGAATVLPLGWTATYLAVGSYKITHNLNSTTYIPTPSVLDPGGAIVATPYITAYNVNDFSVGVKNAAGVYLDCSLQFRVDALAFTS